MRFPFGKVLGDIMLVYGLLVAAAVCGLGSLVLFIAYLFGG